MKITSRLAFNYLKQNKKRSVTTVIGVALAVIIITVTLIILSSYQEYVLNIKRFDRNWEAEFKNITYANAKEIEKDSNIKEISIIHNIGTSKENFSEHPEENTLDGDFRINVSEYNENAIKNNARLTSGRFPERPYEITLSENEIFFVDKEKVKLGNDIDITINGNKNTYTIVGFVEKLPTDVGGFSSVRVIGGIVYFNKKNLTDDTVVDVSILTNDIKKIHETTNGLLNRLNLYESDEEKEANFSYYDILLNYALVNGENMEEKYFYEYGERESQEYRVELAKVVTTVLVSTGVIAVIVIYTTFKMTYSERIKELRNVIFNWNE